MWDCNNSEPISSPSNSQPPVEQVRNPSVLGTEKCLEEGGS